MNKSVNKFWNYIIIWSRTIYAIPTVYIALFNFTFPDAEPQKQIGFVNTDCYRTSIISKSKKESVNVKQVQNVAAKELS
jgi:hypothetical protein